MLLKSKLAIERSKSPPVSSMTGRVAILTVLLAAICACSAQECTGIYADSLAHPSDCSRYYNLYLMTCPEGELYDTRTRQCVAAAQSECGQTSDSTIPTEATDTTTQNSTAPSTTEASTAPSTTEATTAPSTTQASTAPSTTQASTAPSTTQASTATSTTQASTTPSTTQASTTPSTTEASTAPSTTTQATTPTATTTLPPITDSTTEATTSWSSVPTEGSTTPAPSRYSCPAQDDPAVKVRYAHETNCNLYYLCVSGTPTLYLCSNSWHFSPTQKACKDPEQAACDRCPPVEVARLPHESMCSLYYRCEGGIQQLYACPDDYQFSREARLCATPEEAWCSLESVVGSSTLVSVTE